MTTHSILFQPNMIEALQAGRKTQTRRLPNSHNSSFDGGAWPSGGLDLSGAWIDESFPDSPILKVPRRDADEFTIHRLRPRVQVGDFFWVKERHWAYGYWETSRELTKAGKLKRKFIRDIPFDHSPSVRFKTPDFRLPENKRNRKIGWYARNSLFHSKRDSRTTLTVTGVRVQRLQDINEADAVAEGCRPFFDDANPRSVKTVGGKYIEMSPFCDSRDSFRTLINSINGPDTWSQNPWVIAYSFEVEHRNVLAMEPAASP